MSNPQINTLKNQGNLQSVQEDILDILTKYCKGKQLCSHEILGLASASTIKAISDGIFANQGIDIKDRGYSLPSTWVGSVASDMANRNEISRKDKYCIYSGHNDDAWYL